MLNEKTLSSISIAGNQVLKIQPAHTVLSYLLGVDCHHLPLLRSGQIDTLEKCRELLEVANELQRHEHQKGKVSKPLRLTSMQLCWVDDEWDLIQNQQRVLIKMKRENPSSFDFAHLSFPTEHAFLRRDPKAISEFTQKTIARLHQQMNNEAWLVYCQWLNEEVETVLKTFQPEASEEYQLQARLEDLGHEVHSHLLIASRGSIATAILEKEEAIAKGERERLFALEKAIVAGREQLKRSLEAHSEVCGNIVEGITKIEAMHPELMQLKLKTRLLHELILDHLGISGPPWSWGKKLLLIQLLDEEFGVIPAINCDTGIERTNMVFSILLALIELKAFFSKEDILELCLNWDSDSKDQQELRSKLNECVQLNLHALSAPSPEQQPQATPWGPSPEFLPFTM